MPIVPIILAALASLARKLLITSLVKKVLAALMFLALDVLVKRTDNLIDNQLVDDVYFAYHGKARTAQGSPVTTVVGSTATDVPAATVVLVNSPRVQSEAVSSSDSLLPKQLTDQ